jgi:hypothetical protein
MCHRDVTPMAASGGAVNNASAAVPSHTGNVTFPEAQSEQVSGLFIYFSVYLTRTQAFIKLNCFNPHQSNFSAARILPSFYLFRAGKRLVDYF